ncbi:hypothetical protein ABGI61_11240 [Rheinheimera sp. FR7-31]|uniref:hypothetical protein n=1 Tax=Rheinheimera fenheensis TaxID=3152295 RepID=UPI00325EE677
MDIDKWAERIYQEEDFGKNVSTTISGLLGLIVYLLKDDFALAAFITIITFPVVKILSNILRNRHLKKSEAIERENARKEMDDIVKNLTDQERRVIHEFVKYKSSVMSEKYIKMNSVFLPDGAVKSLMERSFLTEQTFLSGSYDLKLNIVIFEAGRRYFEK